MRISLYGPDPAGARIFVGKALTFVGKALTRSGYCITLTGLTPIIVPIVLAWGLHLTLLHACNVAARPSPEACNV